MPIAEGTRLGPYQVKSALGAGGMGEVYRARDTRLDRTVAIKVLPSVRAADPAFRDRFEREARTLSGVNHPNICTVFDVGSHAGTDYLVMELLEGQTLAQMLEKGPLPLSDALRLARQVADALAAAHRLGVVHRDLKPANVMIVRGLGSQGPTAKLLDFGLAKRAAVMTSAAADVTARTLTTPLTGVGTILGTFQYMAPEQIEGRDVDARVDVWAFGSLLYEMITGRRAFQAATQASLIAAILERQPPAIQLPDSSLTPALNRVISACLEKDPNERFQSIRDVARELDWMTQAGPTPAAATAPFSPARRSLLRRGAVAAGIVLAVAAAAWLLPFTKTRATRPPTSMFTIGLDAPGFTAGPALAPGRAGAGSGTPMVSPDGTQVAFLAHDVTESYIWIRDLNSLAPVRLSSTSGARAMFWSPDGHSLGFFANGKLKTIELATSRIEVLCDAPQAHGGSWSGDTILFSPADRSAIYKVSAQGGTPVQATTLVPGKEEAHRWPWFLPDGRHFIYMPWRDGSTTRDITLASLDGEVPRVLFQSQSAATPGGNYLLFVRDLPSRLMAWPFDMRTLELGSKPISVLADNNVDYNWYTGEPNASASGTTLSYTTGKYARSQLTWFDRYGRAVGTLGDIGIYFDPILSRDGTHLALEIQDPGQGSGDVWTVDLARGAFTRISSLPGYETTPVWSPDRSRVAYASDQSTIPHIFVNGATGGGEATLFINSRARAFPQDWSPDGKYVVYSMNGDTTGGDLWLFDVATKATTPLLQTPFNEGWARISPDGKWMAYASSKSQRREVYVTSFPAGDETIQISNAGGHEPQWRGDSRELFYIAPDNAIMAVAVRPRGKTLDADRPQPLFTAVVDQDKTLRNQWTVTPDGERFLVLSLIDRNASPIVTVLNWQSQLR